MNKWERSIVAAVFAASASGLVRGPARARGTHAGSGRYRLMALAVAVVVSAGTANPSWAAPEVCQHTGVTGTCTGNQAHGIELGKDIPTTVTNLTVQGLSTAIAPAARVRGIGLPRQAAPGRAGSDTTLNFDAAISTVDADAAVLVSQKGGNGAAGRNGSVIGSGAGPGGPGMSAGNAVVAGQGSVQNSVNVPGGRAAVWVEAINGNGGNGGNSCGAVCKNGGAGGSGYAGLSGLVSLHNQGDWTIASTGASGAMGIYLSSAGGGGGNGGEGGGTGEGGKGGAGGVPHGLLFGSAPRGNVFVATAGPASHGLYLRQQAGDGGAGGTFFGLAAGGDGGNGGNGSTTSVNLGGSFVGSDFSSTTAGTGSAGLYAWTSAGNGGNGHNGGLLGNGGYAGNGGQGGSIDVTSVPGHTASISTSGARADGVFLLSEAGNGGNGGRNLASGGKNGGWGGGGGAISLRGNWSIATAGAEAHGIVAQSLGGTGGMAGSGGVFGGGGRGGNTGPSGPITLATGGSILTTGAGAYGILAQSIAGHAGNGGTAIGFVPFGAAGGSAGNGGALAIANTAAITTRGEQAVGIVAQSIGGGGGSGGDGFGVFYSNGGSGSGGGNGGTVSVTNSGNLTLSGNDAAGIAAQSIGGTGGIGGTSGALIAAFGGGGGLASDGGAVTVTNHGVIETGKQDSGNDLEQSVVTRVCGTGCSEGISAQSIGGGGGKAGTTGGGWFSIGAKGGGGGNGGAVAVNNFNSITTALERSAAIDGQSVGGGGGNGGGSGAIGLIGSVAIGGTGGGAGHGGDVALHHAVGALVTEGKSSPGVSAQSVGGAGGKGGFAVSAALGPKTPAIAVAVGGKGGDGGNGGEVRVHADVETTINTAGEGSEGILAQSSGGGGGSGGFAIAVAAATPGVPLTISASVGGEGGKGGSGRAANVVSGARISTLGDASPGISAESVGGGGGNGGFSISAAAAFSPDASLAVSVGVGGKAGGGGNGSKVTVTNPQQGGDITTEGKDSHGINAQSIGGGGGNGGFTIDFTAGQFGLISFGVGGAGGKGGFGDEVFVQNLSSITTSGSKSNGIFAQSISNGGGRGGMSLAVAQSWLGKGGAAVSIGGVGGDGGAAGPVRVDNRGDIAVTGWGSIGIEAQSIGGGGGDGGLSLAVAAGGGGGAKQLSIAVGGKGAKAGMAGPVTVTNSGRISTGAAQDADVADNQDAVDAPPALLGIPTDEHGIFAQSVGGPGGNGGLAGTFTGGFGTDSESTTVNIGVTVGGFGGAGGVGGAVRVENSGAISTAFNSSHAIFAQSIGGDGGSGGASVNYVVEFGQEPRTSVLNTAVAVGGFGGRSSIGGPVRVDNSAALATFGVASHGIYGSSVGGGGGSGGNIGNTAFTFAGFRPGKDEASWKMQFGVGGKGGSGNHGGTVTILNSAPIATHGPGSFAIYAYSIGGGGGDGGGAAGLENQFPGIPFVDRVTKFQNLSINIGGFQGAQGNGGEVKVTQTGATLATEGADAPAIFAQSVGGGGGRGGASSGSLQSPSISVGGLGHAAGNGGNVTVEVQDGARILTTGGATERPEGGSFGIFAQSVGGGGGVGGNGKLQGDPTGTIPSSISIGIGLGIGGGGGDGGDGGKVAVTVDGDITTTGASGAAVFAQSVGGGGGVSGADAISPFGRGVESIKVLIGSGSDSGSGGPVVIDYSGNIRTSGGGAHGIFAQSAGGGHKLPDVPADGSGAAALRSVGGNVTIDFAGRLEAGGLDAHGILAHSGGGDGNGNIAISVAAGSLVSGGQAGKTNNGAGIMVMDGAANTLINAGTITSVDKIGVVHTGEGTLKITNTGTIDGDILLGGGGGANRLDNQSGGLVAAGLIDLGGGVLKNDGMLSPGGNGRVGSTLLTGTLVQGSSGMLVIDLNNRLVGTANQADLLTVDGAAGFSGRIQPNFIDPGIGGSGEQTVTILRADELVSTAVLASDSAVAQYRLVQPSSRELALAYNIDFANAGILAGVNANQDNVARQIEAIYRAGALDPGVGRDLINIGSADYAATMNSLGAEIAVDNQIASLRSSMRFSDGLFGCAERSGQYRFIRHGQCGWGRILGHHFKQSATSDNLGFDNSSWQLATGVQFAAGNDWRLGAAVSWEQNSLGTNGAGTSDGYQFNLGLSATRNFDAAELSGSLAFGYASNQIQRDPSIGRVSEVDQSVHSVAAHLRAAYLFGDKAWYLKPRIDFGVERLHMPGFSESGDSPFALNVQSQSDTYVNIQPALEIGTEFDAGNGMLVRPRLTLALTQFIGSATPSVSAGFASTPSGVDPFQTSTSLDRTQWDLAIGADLFATGGTVVRAEAFTSFSENTSAYGGSLTLEMRF